MNSTMTQAAVPGAVERKLHLVRQRKMWVQALSAVVAAVAVLLTAMAIAMMIDWLATIYDARWRWILTGTALAVTAATVGSWLAITWRRGLRRERVALEIDRQLPQMEERLTTMTRLGEGAKNPSVVHPAMLRRLTTEASTWEPHVDPQQVVSLQLLRRSLLGLTGIAAALCLAAFFDSHRTLVLMRRFWQPNALISATELVGVPGDLVVARGEPVDLTAAMKGLPVEQATLFLQSPDATPETVTLVANNQDAITFLHRVRAVESPFRYQFRAGDGQTEWHSVSIAERPEIAELKLTITPPAYTGRPAASFDDFPRRINALEKSQLELAIRPSLPLKGLQLRLADNRLVDMAADTDGWYRWTKTLEQNVTLSPLLTEPHGLTNRRVPKTQIIVVPDKPPVVKILTPSDQLAVRPDDTVKIHFMATDDNGIGDAELVVFQDSDFEGEQTPLLTIPIPLEEQVGSKKVEGTVALDLAKLEAKDGSRLSYEIRVRESRDGEVNAAAADRANKRERPARPNATPQEAQRMAANQGRGGDSKSTPTTSESQNLAGPTGSAVDFQNNTNNVATQSQASGDQETVPPSDNVATSGETRPNDRVADSGNAQPRQSLAMSSASPPAESSSSSRPPNDMSPRTLDIPAQGSSSRMRIEVDQWAGSFDGQQRQKLEIAIAPEIDALDAALARAQASSRSVLDELEAPGEWRGKHDRDMTTAERSTVDAQQVIRRLNDRTRNTPYAYIGLQLTDIGTTHVSPARQQFWASLQTAGDTRVSAVREGWQHVTRARQLLADLEAKFESARREYALADKLQQVKKMYQVFIEDSFSLLNGEGGDPQRYAREGVEFNLDEEYLKRLREVLEMRREMMKELARILADDPRLLQRFMDSFRNRAASLREKLADLVTDQNDLNREVTAWVNSNDTTRPQIAELLLQRHLHGATNLASAAGDLQDGYHTWLPLDRQSSDADLESATKLIEETASVATELAEKATTYVEEMRRVRVRPTANATGVAAPQPAWDSEKAFTTMRGSADTFSAKARDLEVVLRQMAARSDNAEIAVFAANRLGEARRLIAANTDWTRQLDEHKAGNYSRAAEVQQYRLAEETDRLAGQFGGIEQTLANLLQRRDGQLPQAISEKSREMLAALDNQVAPNQMAAVYALRRDQMPTVTERQKAAQVGLVAAEKAFDDMMKQAIVELDKLPVPDPIAGLLNDPTLDELLAMLEQESLFEDALDIPSRPSNLMVVGDWMRPGSGSGMRSGRAMANNQLRQRGARARNRLEKSLKEAIARALNEGEDLAPIMAQARSANVNWNRLVAELDDELQQGRDKAPPEQYRQAISQYFDEISRAAASSSNEERP